MDSLVDSIFTKGIVFTVATVATGLLAWLIKSYWDEKAQEFKEYREAIKLCQKEIMDTGASTKTVCNQLITSVKLEVGTLRTQVDKAKVEIEKFNLNISKEAMGLKIHANSLHERSEKINESMNLILGKVRVIETNQQQYDVVFKKLINKAKT